MVQYGNKTEFKKTVRTSLKRNRVKLRSRFGDALDRDSEQAVEILLEEPIRIYDDSIDENISIGEYIRKGVDQNHDARFTYDGDGYDDMIANPLANNRMVAARSTVKTWLKEEY